MANNNRNVRCRVDKQTVYFILEIILVFGTITACCIFREEVRGFIEWMKVMGLIRPWM